MAAVAAIYWFVTFFFDAYLVVGLSDFFAFLGAAPPTPLLISPKIFRALAAFTSEGALSGLGSFEVCIEAVPGRDFGSFLAVDFEVFVAEESKCA